MCIRETVSRVRIPQSPHNSNSSFLFPFVFLFGGFQFFGQVDIDHRSKDLVVALKDINGQTVFSKRLDAKLEYVIPYGIDDPCAELSDSAPNSAPAAGDRLRMLYVGLLNEGKGVLVLIEACAPPLRPTTPSSSATR